MKTLTVIIPCFNASKTVEKAIDSLNLEELGEDIDVLAVDDGSTDDTWNVLKSLQKKYPKSVKAYTKKNGNYGSVMNFCTDKVESKFVKTLDADDTYVKENMIRFIQELKSMPESTDVVFTNFNFININTGKRTKNSLTWQFNLCQKNLYKPFAKISKSGFGYQTIHSMAFRSELFKTIKKLPEGIFYTDTYLIYQITKKSRNLCYIPHLYIYNYFISNEEQSINITNISKRRPHINRVLYAILDDLDWAGLNNKHRSWLIAIVRMTVKWMFLSLTFSNETNEEKSAEIDRIVYLVKNKTKHNMIFNSIMDIQMIFIFNFSPKTVLSVIKFSYGVSFGKFAKSTKNKKLEKRREKRRQEFSKNMYNVESK